MNVVSFQPEFALAKNVTISAASQSVDVLSDTDQILFVNTSTGSVAVKWGRSSAGAITAAFTEGNGLILPAGFVGVFSKDPLADRFAVIGAIANGTFQVVPGVGL